MYYEIFTLPTFDKIYEGLDHSEQFWIQKIKQQLEQFPTGKILQFSWIREKRYGSKRLYYIIDELRKRMLLINFVPKKDQQKIINYMVSNQTTLFLFLRKL